MTSIEQLQISGIRSFDPNPANRQSIVFQKPLTVILGKNGAGKTTVIEALLNACTGIMPPGIGTEKSSFIYDPRTVGESEVKAQIRLIFTGKGGKVMQVIRSFQATQTRNKTTFSTLDNTVAYQDAATGKIVSSTYRASDVDRVVPEMLGVSAAVLEHVIFCHQEDCNWPLAAPKDVKKIFDEIFSATRYVLALDRLRENNKEFRKQLKEHEATLLTLREHRDQAKQVEESIAEKRNAVRQIGERRKNVEPQLKALRDVVVSIDAVQQQAEALAKDAAVLQGRIGEKQSAMARENVPLPTQSLDELIERRRVFSSDAQRLEADIAEKARQLTAMKSAQSQEEEAMFSARSKLQILEQQESQISFVVNELCRHMSSYVSESSADRETMMKLLPTTGTSPMIHVPAEDAPFTDSSLRSAAEEVSGHASCLQEGLTAKQAAFQSKLLAQKDRRANTQRLLDVASAEITLRQTNSDSAAKRLAAAEEAFHATRPVVTDDTIAEAQRAVEEMEERIRKAKEVREKGSVYQQAKAATHDIEERNRRVAQLRQDMARSRQVSTVQAEIPFLKKQLAEKKLVLDDTLTGKLLPALQRLGKDSVFQNVASVTTALHQVKQKNDEMLATLDRDQRNLDRELATLALQNRQTVEELMLSGTEIRSSVESCLAALKGSSSQKCTMQVPEIEGFLSRSSFGTALVPQTGSGEVDVDDEQTQDDSEQPTVFFEQFESLLNDARGSASATRQRLSAMEAMASCFAEFAHAATANHKCVVCDRGFASTKEEEEFLARNQAKQQSSPEERDAMRAEMGEYEAVVHELESLEPLIMQVRRHAARHPVLQKRRAEIDASMEERSAALTACREKRGPLENIAMEVDNNLAIAGSLNAVVGEIDRIAASIAQSEKHVESILRSGTGSGEAVASYEELSEEYEQQTAALQGLHTRLAELQRQQGEESDTKLESEKTAAQTNLRDLQAKMSQQASLRESIASARNEMDELVAALRSLEERRAALQQELSTCQASISSSEQEWETEAVSLRAVCTKAATLKQHVDTLAARVSESLRSFSAKELKAVRDRVATLESNKQQRSEVERQLTDAVSSGRKTLDAQHTTYADLEKSIRVLEIKHSVDADRKRLTEVEQSLAALKNSKVTSVQDLLGADVSSQPVTRIHEMLRAKISELERSSAQQEGNLETITQDVNALIAQLDKDKYRNIEKRYQSTYLKVQTTELAVKDIDKYYRALEMAVQSYHQEKIEQINQIIEELWRQTYRGSDIDTIELHSEVDPSSSAARRSYNYRVVMKRGNSELDMRGRCSAGQKVLASVIIRLALSEAFCYDCGILALDEPTTNLDEDNARSLAESLRLLIDTRREVKHFQLIVITHDEQFVRALGGHAVDRFYFIHKDREGAFSVIEERTFQQLFA